MTLEAEMMPLERRVVEKLGSSTEGRGDPTSAMLWSPRKHAGCKRPLEAAEAKFWEEEEGSGSEGTKAELEVKRLESATTGYQSPEHEAGEQQGTEDRMASWEAAATKLRLEEATLCEGPRTDMLLEAAAPG